MGGRERLIGSSVVALILVVLFYIALVKPERSHASSLQGQITTEQSTLGAEQAQLTAAEQARSRYPNAIRAAKVLENAVPLSDRVPQLIRLINKLEVGHKVVWSSTSFEAGTPTPAGFQTLNVAFAFTVPYLNLQQFFHNLDQLTRTDGANVYTRDRLFTVDSVNLAANPDGQTSAQVQLTVYQLPTGLSVPSSTTTTGATTTTAAG